MKQGAAILIWCLLLLVGCTVETALPTAIPVQVPTNTSIPSATTTRTPDPTSTPTATSTLGSTSTPTVTPTRPFPTFTPEPTQRPKRVPDAIDPSLSLPTGQMFMIWDPDPPEYIDGEFKGSFNYDLYRFIPGAMPTLDIIDVAPAHLFNAPYVLNVSPDRKKIAFILLDDTNGNGRFDSHGYDTDYQTIHLYDVASNTLVPFAAGDYSISSLSWFPDSQALLYPQGNDIFLAGLGGSPPKPLVNFPDAHINNITLSPNGHFLVTYGNNYQIQVYDFEMEKVVAIADDTKFRDMRSTQWSPEGSLLAFGQHGMYSSRPLSLFNTETLEFTVSVALDEEDLVSIPSWSSDGQWLAFTTNQSTLYLWNRDSLAVTEILTSTYISAPVWSPVDNQVAVGLIEENASKLLVIDTVTGNTQEWVVGNDIQEIRLLSWSPDGNWVAFIAIGADGSGLYIAPKQGEKVYLMLDLMGGDAVGQFVWLPDF